MGDEADSVRAANQAFYRAFESLELGRMDALWAHDDAVSCLHPGWPLCVGWEEVRRSWATIFANTGAMRFDVDDERVEVRGELAWVVCSERIRSTVAGQTMAGAIAATNVFRRQGTAWQLVHHHGSPLVPRTMAPVPPPDRAVN
jgi:ketosteroid isomerase-like protein